MDLMSSANENTSTEDLQESLDEEVFTIRRKKKITVITSDSSDTSDDESNEIAVDTSFADATSNTLAYSYQKVDETVLAPNESNDSGAPLRTKKKITVITSDSSDPSDDESNEIAVDTSFGDETSNTPAYSFQKVDETVMSPNDSGTPLNVASPSNKESRDANNSAMMTPRTVKPLVNSDSESETDVVEVSSDEENIASDYSSARKVPPKYTPSLNRTPMVQRQEFRGFYSSSPETQTKESPNSGDEFTALDEYLNQKKMVDMLESDLQKSRITLRTVNLSALPDRGQMLSVRQSSLETALQTARSKLSKMKVKEVPELRAQAKPIATWDELETASTTVQPKTFGKKAMTTYNTQKTLTMDSLQELHSSIKTRPTEDVLASDPKGLKVELMDHQKHALAWLIWREDQKPSGGILADDMGLGKTLTMISLMLKQCELQNPGESSDEENIPRNQRHKYNGGSLIICPASLLRQWEEEVSKHCRKRLLTVELYHGPKREARAKSLARFDMVITTYAICVSEFERSTPINSIYWKRIILDEGHQIKNFKCTTAKAVCELSAKSRWVLTGTPVHNKELDMYSLLKFLRCSPFDDIAVWKRWVTDRSHGGQQRLHTVLSSLMLRRTKQQLQERGVLTCLPDRRWELVEITLKKAETDVYQKVLIFSRTLFAQFLHQRAEKETDYREQDQFNYAQAYKGNAEYHKMHKMLLKLNKVKTIKQHDILVLLLRLRQICCHPFLITGMLRGEDTGEDEDYPEEMNILEQLNKLNIDDVNTSVHNTSHDDKESDNLAQNCRILLNPSNPVFEQKYKSSKIQALMQKLDEHVLQTDDKAVIVSQFTSFLNIVAIHLKQENIHFKQLDGSVPVIARKDIVSDFNNRGHPTKVLLLSLTAGGVGLNLVGGNHLFLMDLHWNPQLELQAQDRIYRVGQEKSVYVYKFITMDTIEQRVKKLQDSKLDTANSMLTGAKLKQSKLTLEDLKMLFSM